MISALVLIVDLPAFIVLRQCRQARMMRRQRLVHRAGNSGGLMTKRKIGCITRNLPGGSLGTEYRVEAPS